MASSQTVKKLSVKFEGDTKGLNTAINKATQSFRDIDKAIKTLNKGFKDFGADASLDEQIERLNLLDKKIEEGTQSLKRLKDFQKQLDEQSSDNKLTSAYQNLKLKILEVENSLKQAKEQQKQFSDISKTLATYAKIKNKIIEANNEIAKSNSYIEILNKALDYSPNSVELLNAKTLALNDQMKSVNNEVKSLARYLTELKSQGVSETSKEFLEVSNTLAKLKGDYATLKTETVAYQQALISANKLQADMANRGSVLKEALKIDPTNTQVANQYTTVLRQELLQAEQSAEAFRLAIDSLPNSVKKTSQEYINLTTGLVKVEENIRNIRAEQERWSSSGKTIATTLEDANNVLQNTQANAQILKDAFNLDTTNLNKASQYCNYLDTASKKCETQIASLNNLLKKMDSGKVKKTEESYNKIRTTLNALTKQLNYFKEEQKQLSPEAVEYNNKLQSIKSSLSNMDRVAKALKDALALDPTNTQKQAEYTEYLKKAIEECTLKQKELNSQISGLKLSNNDVLSGKYVTLTETLNTTTRQANAYREELDKISDGSVNTASGTDALISDFMALNNILPTVERGLNRITTSLFDNASSYESNISSIRKVVKDLSNDTVDELKQIAVSTGSAFSNVSSYATLGATLGIAEENLSQFTKAMLDLETASDGAISGEEGASAVARLLNQFKIGAGYAENFGSSVTYVGDQFAATANEILETSSYMGGLSAINNVTIHDLIGLASEMKNLGIESASGASAISKTFLKINTEVSTGGDKLEQFAKTAGMTVDEFSKAWANAPTDAFLSFINGLSTQVFDEINESVSKGSTSLENYAKALDVSSDAFSKMWKQDPKGTFEKYKDALGNLEEGSTSASVILDDLSLSGVRVAQTLLKLAGNGDVVRGAIEDSNKAWQENTNLSRKANEMYSTTASKLEQARESIRQMASALGEVLLPIAKNVADAVKGLATTFSKLPSGVQATTGIILLLATGLGKLLTVGAKASITLKVLSNSTGILGKAVNGVTKKLSTSGGLISLLGSSLPVALGVASAGLLAYAGYELLVNNETVKLNKKMKELSETASNTYVSALEQINSEMRNVAVVIDDVQQANDNLEFNKDGTVDIASESYQNLQTKISELNTFLGSDFQLSLDTTTGLIMTQNGEVANLEETFANLRLEKERNAWLDAHQEEYNENLKIQVEQSEKLVDAQGKLNKYKQDYINAGTGFSEEEINTYFRVASGLESTANWSQTAKDKYQAFMEYVYSNNDGLLGAFTDFSMANDAVEKSSQIIDNFNQINTAPIEEVGGLLDKITTNEQIVAFNYDQESLDTLKTNLDELNEKIKNAKDLQEQGFDMSKLLEQYQTQKDALQTAIDGFKTTTDDSFKTLTESNALAVDTVSQKWMGEEGFLPVLGTKWDETMSNMNASIDEFNLKKINDKSYTVTEYFQRKGITDNSISNQSKKVYGSGGYGVPNLTIPTLKSGGFNQITLKASFQINNNGNNITKEVTQKIGKDIVNYINESLGRSM